MIFGNEANAIIDNTILTLTPYETREGGVVWRCAGQDVPADGNGVTMSPMGSSGSGNPAIYDAGSIDLSYLPANCR